MDGYGGMPNIQADFVPRAFPHWEHGCNQATRMMTLEVAWVVMESLREVSAIITIITLCYAVDFVWSLISARDRRASKIHARTSEGRASEAPKIC